MKRKENEEDLGEYGVEKGSKEKRRGDEGGAVSGERSRIMGG